MSRFYTLAIVLVALAATVQSATAQRSLILVLPDTPCDSVSCGSLVIDEGRSGQTIRVSETFRDARSFSSDTTVAGETIPSGAPIEIDVCFQPMRRGQTTDSLSVILETAGVRDTVRIRVTARAIGAQIEPDPFAINFPRTNPGASSNVTVTMRNIGELPFRFDASAISIPAPFGLATAGPITIPAGGAAPVDLSFTPIAPGVFSKAAQLTAGCSIELEIALNGATDFIGTGAVVRTSKSRFNPVNQEEAPCHLDRCTPVTISNAGNAGLIVEDVAWALGTGGYAITNPPSLPFVVAPNSQHTLEVCMNGSGPGRYRDTLVVRSNSRISIAFGLLMDFSGSMDTAMPCGSGPNTKRYLEAKKQAQQFIGRTLLYLPAVNIQDELMVMRYSDSTARYTRTVFPLQPITDVTRQVAQDSIALLTPGGETHTGTAMLRLMDSLLKTKLQKRVVVLISDGAAKDVAAHPPAVVAARAVALGIRLFTIGIGVSRDLSAQQYLQNLAALAGGEYYDGDDCEALQAAFETITDQVSRGQVAREAFEVRITEPALISSGDLSFDSTYYMSTSCKSITLTNIGEGEAVVDSIQLRDALGAASSEFFFPPSVVFPLTVPESGQLAVDLCFRPTGLRQRGGTSEFSYNSCSPHIIGARVSGTAWATAALRIDDERIGLPGSTATMPIHLDSSLVAFEVTTVRFSARWNKSMLDLQTVRPLAAAGTGSVTLASPVRYEGRDAVADFVATGDFQAGAGALAELDFLVLRGDSLASEVALTSLVFEDDNPKPLMKNAGLIAFDSTCFRSSKALLVNTATAKLVHVDVVPIPAKRGIPVTLSLRANGETSARISVYSATGSLVQPPMQLVITSNDQTILIAGELAIGAYFVLVEDGSGVTHVRRFVVSE